MEKLSFGYLYGEGKAGVILIHEWWGVDSSLSNVKELSQRLSEEGFRVLALDFYLGKTADNPEDAGKLMNQMFERLNFVDSLFLAGVEYLKSLGVEKVGVSGFCCGGSLALYLPSRFPDKVSATVPFYGLHQLVPLKWENLKMPTLCIYAQEDEFVDVEEAKNLIEEANKKGANISYKVFEGVSHAFLNDKRPEVYNKEKAEEAWKLMVDFFKKHLL